MDQIYVKYNNLKQFILTIDKDNEWCIWLQGINYEQFHLTVITFSFFSSRFSLAHVVYY